jgi:uncharacterized membrane protein YeaQ/YmgE (transglycosylase-associated protein family)
MSLEFIVIWILIGILAGWIAGKVVTGSGFGLVGDMIVGIIGAVIAGWLLPRLGITAIVRQPFVDNVIFAAIGAIILLVVLRLIRR